MPAPADAASRPPLPPVLHVVGTRPNFMKAASVWQGLADLGVSQELAHTGQHYDVTLSGSFFAILDLPAADHHFGVGSGTHAEQTAGVMLSLDALLATRPASAVVVYGDVNSSAGAALGAVKREVPLVHVEAGLRSGDRTMPEEHNRVVIDHLADLLLTPSRDADANLAREGIPAQCVAFAGNTMVDTLLRHVDRAAARGTIGRLGLAEHAYVLVTLHRPALTDEPSLLAAAAAALSALAERLPVVFPVHPRTRGRLEELDLLDDLERACVVTEPLDYLDFLCLQRSAAAVLTDSGGIQEETTILGVPCFTLRENTERPITIGEGTNTLLGLRPDRIRELPALIAARPRVAGSPERWDGRAGERCAVAIRALVTRGEASVRFSLMDVPG
jgi:UDP-N-acetylglucosamine 2-epimerase (non-hydrolysing)